MSIKVYDIAHCRAGDKGRKINISVIAYNPDRFEYLQEYLTVEKVAESFSAIADGPVTRYELPKIHAFNFVKTDRKMLLVKKSMKNYLRVEICTQPGTGTTCCASTWLSLNIPEIKHRH